MPEPQRQAVSRLLDSLAPWPHTGVSRSGRLGTGWSDTNRPHSGGPNNSSRASQPPAVDATDRLLLDAAMDFLGAPASVPAAPVSNSDAPSSLDAAGFCDLPEPSDSAHQPVSTVAPWAVARWAGCVVVIDDRFGALTLGLQAAGVTGIRLHCDAITAQWAVEANAHHLIDKSLAASDGPARSGTNQFTSYDALCPELFTGAALVVMQLPRSLGALTQLVQWIAAYALPHVTVIAGGRVKHMTHAMNDVLGQYFRTVTPSLARSKSRLLTARQLRPSTAAGRLSEADFTYPTSAELDLPPGSLPSHSDPPADSALCAGEAEPTSSPNSLTVVSYGGVFAATSLDIGTRTLLETASQWPRTAEVAVDLGCGTGILATVLALQGSPRVYASDRSSTAVASTRATAWANGVDQQVTVVRDNAGDGLAAAGAQPGTVDLLVCNPPFHDGSTVSTQAAQAMMRTAAQLLRPGSGQAWLVFNSHLLHYRPYLERTIGPTRQVLRNSKFTVTCSTRRASH